ncbi:LacI family DNA-binding transcriptional regulator [Cohnella sp. JJ-181]|uniref:LacI family DNA-binding transcriptional regulator n=1 Tax=Cohnella rhizoplanae TaxID=2974897 RepID=UPI00232B37E6|nr:LacI family DNA-binding transcriptional regulator [Cohnella sp. JJ-181]
MKISIFDVAKKSGLSVVTVSRVINNAPSVRPGNREKVLRAMRELGYHPSAAARSLARGRTGVIGLTLATLQDSFFDAVVKEISDRLAEQGYFLALSVETGAGGGAGRLIFEEDRVDGVIVLSPMQEDGYELELLRKRIPYILLDNQQPSPSAPSVVVNNFKGGYEAARHLIGLGHREIAHIAGPGAYLSSQDRERGFLQALGEAGLAPWAIEPGAFDIETGYRIASAWIAAGKLPGAVFAADDHIALGVVDACKNAGLRVPRDLSVVGFDDQFLATAMRPALTTVRQPADKIAHRGVELLLSAIGGESRRHVKIQIDPELIVRDSTAAPGGNVNG